MGSIVAQKEGNNTYYVYRETFRVKLNPGDGGKKRGSGKSRVCTRAVYLGSADKILKCIQEKKEPLSVTTRQFGVVAAGCQTATEIGLQEILMGHIGGQRGGVPCWVYFFLTILNRLDGATSKNKMSQWLSKTILPELLDIDPNRLTGKNFWYASDYVLSEKVLKQRRETPDLENDTLAGLTEDVFTKIEIDLFRSIDRLMGLSASTICYDTTNFYTYIEEPKRSELANTCHSKASKHHLRHVGLLMAVEKSHGVPVLSQVYRANRHDSKVFSCILSDLVVTLKKLCGSESDLVIVIDKGNNSKANFEALSGLISWVGALTPSHHKDLIDLDLSRYHGTWKDYRYFRCTKTVMGIQCAIVLTFSSATKRKKEHSLTRGIDKLKKEIRAKWDSYKKKQETVPAGITTLQEKSEYGACVEVSVVDGDIRIDDKTEEIESRKNRFGKNLIFSDMLEAETAYLIDMYHEKGVIEDDFKLLKDETIIRFRPIRHWTDTKIRAYAFCCVVALTLIRVMQWKLEQHGYKMAPRLIKEELSDIREAVLVYSPTDAKRKITDRSAVQKKLWEVFDLGEIEKKLLLHKPKQLAL